MDRTSSPPPALAVASSSQTIAANNGIETSHAGSSRSLAHQQHAAANGPRSSNNISVSSSSSTSSSPPQYSEDMRRAIPPLDLLPRQGSASSTKTCEVDVGDEERDTFSPITTSSGSACGSNGSSPSDAADRAAGSAVTTTRGGICNGSPARGDNKAIDGSLAPSIKLKVNNGHTGNLHSTTKEEKQRQNEEIVIMETSSISSETGSWESVFPHAAGGMMGCVPALPPAPPPPEVDLRNCCPEFLQTKPKEKERINVVDQEDAHHLRLLKEPLITPYLRERTYSSGAAVTADTSSLFGGGSGGSASCLLQRELEKRDNALIASGTSACFIDASSLRDEDEVLSFPSLDGHQSTGDLQATDEKEAYVLIETQPEKVNDEALVIIEDESPTKKLETFHKAFAKCKVKQKDSTEDAPLLEQSKSSSSSNSGSDSPQKAPSAASATSTNNLSDEEKLWKREHGTQKTPATMPIPIKDSSGDMPANEDATEASVSLAADLDSSDSSEIVKLRREREQERKQGPYIFHHNMQQFSIHPLSVSPKFTPHGVSSHIGSSAGMQANNSSTAHSDLSYTTDYSSSSPAPSLVWSEHEQQRPSMGASSSAGAGVGTSGGEHGRGSGLASRLHGEEFIDGPHHKPGVMAPDTPHNSIVHIDPSSSNTSSIHRDYTMSSSFSHQRDSGAYCSDATDSPVPLPRTPKRSKFDEANPIISGGASIKDFSLRQCESPVVKRRTDTCPVVSGGFTSLDFEHTRPIDDNDDAEDEEVELRAQPKTRKPIPGISSWVVDMSDCRQERRKSTSSTSSMEAPPAKFRERSDSCSSHKSGCGFYVSLDDMDKKRDDPSTKPMQSPMSKSYTTPKSTGFFVNLSKSEYASKDAAAAASETSAPTEGEDKKNIFSMFIDIGNDRKLGKKEPFSLAQRLSSSITASHRRPDEAARSSASSTETLMAKSGNTKPCGVTDEMYGGESKSLDYKCNLEAPITVAAIRRISQQQRAQNDASKRHSWGNNSNTTKEGVPQECKRSISLTANGDGKDGSGGNNGLMSIIDKLPIISKTSSLSIDSSLSPYEDYTGSKSGLSTCSNNSARNSMSGGERDDEVFNAVNGTGAGTGSGTGAGAGSRMKKRRRDVQINETFDKSSLASLTDGILSKDLSPASTTDTEDLTFQQDEELALREAAALQQQQQQQSQQVQGTPSQAQSQGPSNRSSALIMETIVEAKETSSPKKNASGHTMETLHATIEKQKMLLETVTEQVEKSSFVKLSDMDKPIKLELHSPESMSKSVGNHRQINRLFRDESKVRPHSWTMTRSTGNSIMNITSSVENMRSLSRLFPNFSKEFSNSLPNDMILDQMDYIQTDISADSSLASSFSRSGMDESSISCRQPRRLGEDLLKMFLQEIATDMIVEVHGRRIKAHKCILRSRCQYFAAMLAGHGAQSVVSLPGYSFSAVHFALCHIYSGASHPPDGISLMELAALADLLGLEGLKEVTAHALKTNYCHNFHKPCSGCIDGILQVLPVALNHALDDLYRKCLRWTCRHYLKVWPTRQFAQLPADILARCRQQIVAYLTSESVLDTVLDCDNLLAQLASFRWGGICENLVRDILDSAYAYVADHFASLVASDSFLSLGHDRSCHIPRLEGLLLRTASSLTPDQACRSYQRVTRLNTVLQAKIIQMPPNLSLLAKELQGLQEEDLDWDPEYIRLVSAILSAVEQCLIRQCSRAMRVTAWQRMDLELRKKIQTLARLTEPLDMKRNKPVSKAFTFSGSTRNQDLYQVKLAIQAHSKRTLAQDTQLYKATQTHEAGNVQTADRGVQANNDLREGGGKILKSNSRAHVPQTHRATSQSAIVSERNSINTHRRTQSEAPLPTTSKMIAAPAKKVSEPKTEVAKPKAPLRLADVRPRYLEPRKVHNATVGSGPIRSATSSSIPATKGKGRQISSSDSSRNSSPAARKNAINAAKIGTKSINMSLDSLASPSRRGRGTARTKTSDNERFSDICTDSLADSMKSSMITNKTISQESLANTSKLSRSNPLIGNNKMAVNRQNQINNKIAHQTNTNTNANAKPSASRPTSIGTRPPKHLQQQNIKSTGSSPSSVNTAKSAASRLSSVSSTHSSRDQFKNRSISVPGQPTIAGQSSGGPQRHSFLSAKSREILAKRAEKNKLQQEQQQQQQVNSSGDEKSNAPSTNGPLRSASHSAVTAANYNRNSLPSNIPTRRPNTLHLKKTNNAHNRANAPASATAPNNKHKIAHASSGTQKAEHAIKQKIELLIDTNSTAKMSGGHGVGDVISPEQQIESKLERSSTFCKETSDLDMPNLQVIE